MSQSQTWPPQAGSGQSMSLVHDMAADALRDTNKMAPSAPAIASHSSRDFIMGMSSPSSKHSYVDCGPCKFLGAGRGRGSAAPGEIVYYHYYCPSSGPFAEASSIRTVRKSRKITADA